MKNNYNKIQQIEKYKRPLLLLFLFFRMSIMVVAQPSTSPTTVTAPSSCYSAIPVLDPARTYVIYWGCNIEIDGEITCERPPESYCGATRSFVTSIYAASLQEPVTRYTPEKGFFELPFIEAFPPKEVKFPCCNDYDHIQPFKESEFHEAKECINSSGSICETLPYYSGRLVQIWWKKIKGTATIPQPVRDPICTNNPLGSIDYNSIPSPGCNSSISFPMPLLAIYDVTNGIPVLIPPDQNCGKCTPILCPDGKSSGCTSCDTGCVPQCDPCGTVRPTIQLKT